MITPVEDSAWLDQINLISRQASLAINAQGWIQDQMTGENGELCIIAGAHQAAHETEALGLSHVLREVLDSIQRAEAWNDTEGRTQDEVTGLLAGLSLTESDLHSTFGPDWSKVCYLARMFGNFTEAEMTDWVESRDQHRDFQMLAHMDSQMPPDDREIRARGAVCAAASERAEEFGLNPAGPSVGILVAKIIRPSLQGARV